MLAPADDFQPATVVNHGRSVFIDSQTEERGRLSNQRKQPSIAVALLEVLVDHDVLNQTEAGG